MRCPKCGYISFDHLKTCLKCNKNIETMSAGLFGSTYSIEAPTFLKLNREQREESSEQMDLAEDRSFLADDEYVDKELAILVEEDDADEVGEINSAQDSPAGMSLSDGEEQDDGEIEIDFSQFEDTDSRPNLVIEDDVQQGQAKRHPLEIDMPAALSDISDLAPPAKNIGRDALSSGASADPEFSDLDLDDLNFDLGLDDLDDDVKKSPAVSGRDALSLDELDFTSALAENDPEPAKKTEDLDLDMDLDFDLDLGGLSIHKDA